MSFKEYLQNGANEDIKQTKQEDDDSIKAIQFKIAELINNISKFDSHKTDQVTRSEYDNFMNKNNMLLKTIEESMRREMNQPLEDNKSTMLRFQKVLGEQKKKLKAYSTRKWSFLEEERKVSYDDADEHESAQLLDNDIEIGKLETFEDFVQDRNQRITTIHKNMRVANQIYKDMALMVQEQSEDVEIIHENVESTEHTLKKANKELLKVKYMKGVNRTRYVRLLVLLVFALFCTFYLIRHWRLETMMDETSKNLK